MDTRISPRRSATRRSGRTPRLRGGMSGRPPRAWVREDRHQQDVTELAGWRCWPSSPAPKFPPARQLRRASSPALANRAIHNVCCSIIFYCTRKTLPIQHSPSKTVPAFHVCVYEHFAARHMLCKCTSVASTSRASARPRGHEREVKRAQPAERANVCGRVLQRPSAPASARVRGGYARRGSTASPRTRARAP
jgi:hypothetical protein